ncbi:MAG: BLUF domain-containing protein [Hyphomonadaceae bacterium]
MHRLIYTSKATRLLKRQELFKLLNSARSANAELGITGLLIYHEGCFLQVLEGEKDALGACYKKIQKDGRHTSFIELANEASTGRLFSAWWMAYRDFGELGEYQRKQLVDIRDLAAKAGSGTMVENLKVNAIMLAFLSTFRDLDMAG